MTNTFSEYDSRKFKNKSPHTHKPVNKRPKSERPNHADTTLEEERQRDFLGW